MASPNPSALDNPLNSPTMGTLPLKGTTFAATMATKPRNTKILATLLPLNLRRWSRAAMRKISVPTASQSFQ